MNVALTFDIEFNVNHAMVPPFERKPLGMECVVARDEQGEAGLGYVLQTLEEFGLRATFFVEALQSCWFGDREMGQIAERIARAGHEVQLHLHPVWRLFELEDWRSAVYETPAITEIHDSLPVLPAATAAAVLAQAINAFSRWDVPAPTAVRTGGMITERGIYRLFAEAGLSISSSVGLALHRPEDPALHRYGKPSLIDGVLEVPVTSYLGAGLSGARKLRLATLVGMGLGEQQAVLRVAAEAGRRELVVLSHMSEFFRPAAAGPRRNVLVERRFLRFCERLVSEAGWQAVTISELASATVPAVPAPDAPLAVGSAVSISRFFERVIGWA